jgi:hypothetical protein
MRFALYSSFILVLILGTGLLANVRVLENSDLAAMYGRFCDDGGGCVDNGPCGTALSQGIDCPSVPRTVVEGTNQWTNVICTAPGQVCFTLDVPGPHNITCTGGLGTGCEGGTQAHCYTKTLSFCRQLGSGTSLDPYYCECVPGLPAKIGVHDTCTAYAN